MTSITILRWRRNQRVPVILPVFLLWPIVLILLIVGWVMRIGSTRWAERGKLIVLLTRLFCATRGLRISIQDDESGLEIAML